MEVDYPLASLRRVFSVIAIATLLAGCNEDQLRAATAVVNGIGLAECHGSGGVWRSSGSGGYCDRLVGVRATGSTVPATPVAPVAPVASPRNDNPGIDAGRCVSVRSTGGPGTFFKSQMRNNCSRTIWVAYCEVGRCGTSFNYYDSAETLRPGQTAAVDTVGRGIRYGACVYEAPSYHTVSSNRNGAYNCN